ncbi:restriction endonuclease [Labedaea rhizosphaerae]|uniref:restriction endonuclease n=1 Tax=Labedaea rhizosphaerae TaxID=598644 RepID=UPI0014150602|nr:restriction endonuclease [Labedaea rhizosphaerae]
MVDTSRERLDVIERLSPARRGRELEQFVADLLRQHHFTVRPNAGTARPRQTDVLASRGSEWYLVECKWRSDKANIDDVDSVRSRLNRIDHSVVGVLISMPGFTGTVLHDVGHHRKQPILLISRDELVRLAQGMESLPRLLWRKKEALVADGTVLLDEPTRKGGRARRRMVLPPAESQFISVDGTQSPVVQCGGTFGQVVFVQQLENIDWVPAAGLGVTLDVAPSVLNERELRDLVDHLADLGWATADARWNIQQSTRNWHGVGCAAFANELPKWRQRADIPEAHHSEEICYVDRCDGGFYSLTATLAAHGSRSSLFARVSFQLQGIPLDNGPLLELCKSIGVHESLYFRPRANESVKRHHFADAQVANVQPIHHFVTTSREPEDPVQEWVTGIVIINPFHEKHGDSPTKHLPDGATSLRHREQLVCDLRHHHPYLGRHEYSYRFTGFELAHTSDATVCRPIVDWTRNKTTPHDADTAADRF